MKHLFFFFFIIWTTSLIAQNISLKGIIEDEHGNRLEMANVIAMDSISKAVVSYHVTDASGNYRLTLAPNSTYSIRVSYLGLDTQIKTIQTNGSTEPLVFDFVLLEKTNNLETVEITYEMPVTIKGDTIIYKVDAFTTGKEKKLEDVLEKLPGVEINDDGEVEIEGKKVSKIMVEGKDFFDGDSKLAQKNIPASAVDKVEVLKNYNEVSQMRGLENDEDNIAINIKLKEGKNHFWFGEITAGGGLQEHYLAHPKLFYYSPNKSLNILTDYNNIGEIPFTMRDYFKFSGGIKNMMKKGRSSMRTSSEQLGFSLIKNNRAKSIISRFAALNFNYAISKTIDVNGFAIYNQSDTELLTNNRQVFTATSITNTTTNNALQQNQLGLLKLSANYKPNTNFQLEYNVIAKKSKETELYNTNSLLEGIVDTDQMQNPTSVNQHLNIYYTWSDKHIFSIGAQSLIDRNVPSFSAKSLDEFFESFSLLQMDEENNFILNQDKAQFTNKFDAKIDYFYIINKKSNLNFTLGNTNTAQRLTSKLYQTRDNGSVFYFTNAVLQNDAEFFHNDLFLATHYKVKMGKFTLTPGFSIHQFNIKDIQGTSNTRAIQRVLPDFYALYKIKSSRRINFTYDISMQFSDITKHASGLLLNNYNSLAGGNRDLENSLYHNYSINYYDFNLFNFTNIMGSVQYNKKYNSVKTSTTMVDTESVSYPINTNNPEESLTGHLRYGRRFGKYKAKLNATLNFGKYYSVINDVEKLSKSISQIYKAGFTTRFKKAPNMEVGYKLSVNDYTNGNISSRFITDKPYCNVEVSFWKGFTWTADYSYFSNRNTTNSSENSYSFLSSKLYYQKKKSAWEFILSGTNLLQTTSIDTNTSSNLMIGVSQYFIQPSYYMLSLKYNL